MFPMPQLKKRRYKQPCSRLAGVAVSSGSACTAGSIEPSHVLVAMFGKGSERTKNSIRFSFGLNNTEQEVRQAAETTVKIGNGRFNEAYIILKCRDVGIMGRMQTYAANPLS